MLSKKKKKIENDKCKNNGRLIKQIEDNKLCICKCYLSDKSDMQCR